jgi:hypothetical protein
VIIGQRAGLSVGHGDDLYHPVTSDDPSWIETVWFPFSIPDAGITVSVRIVAQPNRQLLGVTVAAWRGAGERLAAAVWNGPLDTTSTTLATQLDLRDVTFPNGLRHIVEEPLQRYRLVLGDVGAVTDVSDEAPPGELSLDVRFDAVMEPNPVAPEESPGMFLGHLEQPGRMTGVVVIAGQRHRVDCGTVRDRSWGPRLPRSDLRLGNAFGTADASCAFFAYVNPDPDGTERITGGFLLLDGQGAVIRRGLRSTVWDGTVPSAVTITATDALGRALSAEGRSLNSSANDAGNDVYAVLNLMEWTVEGRAGLPVIGENHDVWSRPAWIAAGRPEL